MTGQTRRYIRREGEDKQSQRLPCLGLKLGRNLHLNHVYTARTQQQKSPDMVSKGTEFDVSLQSSEIHLAKFRVIFCYCSVVKACLTLRDPRV